MRAAPLVDYAGVAAAKFRILELLYAHFRERHLDTGSERGEAFRAFQAEGGRALRLHAMFEALQARLHAADPAIWGWPVWPEAYRDPDAEAVSVFAGEALQRIEYYEYLQWQAEYQLAQVGARCRALGLAVGLYLDLAVSVDRAGSDAWTEQDCFASSAQRRRAARRIQPERAGLGTAAAAARPAARAAYRPFIETLRGNMRDAGALRIDHVMGLMRLFWIPAGKARADGTYVHYALDEMLAIVALESQRNRCMVIGEDLGTVADGDARGARTL